MGRQRVQRGQAKVFITPIRAGDVLGGKALDVAGTREPANVAKNARSRAISSHPA